MSDEKQQPSKVMRLVVQYDPERGKIAHQVDDGFPTALLVNELELLKAEAVQLQLLARAQQQAQQRTNGIEIATGTVPPHPPQKRRF